MKFFKKNKCWDNPPIPTMKENDIKEEEDDEDAVEELASCDFEAADLQDSAAIESAIMQLEEDGTVEKDLKNHLVNLKNCTFKRLAGSVQVYDVKKSTSEKKSAPLKEKHCPYVDINHGGKVLYIYTKPQLCGYSKKGSKYLQIDSFEFEISNHFQNIVAHKCILVLHHLLLFVKQSRLEIYVHLTMQGSGSLEEFCIFVIIRRKPKEHSNIQDILWIFLVKLTR